MITAVTLDTFIELEKEVRYKLATKPFPGRLLWPLSQLLQLDKNQLILKEKSGVGMINATKETYNLLMRILILFHILTISTAVTSKNFLMT